MLEIYRLLTEHNITMVVTPNGANLMELEFIKREWRQRIRIDFTNSWRNDVDEDVIIYYLKRFIEEHRKWWTADGSIN